MNMVYFFVFSCLPSYLSAPLPPPFFPSIPSPSPVRECQSCPDFNEDLEIGGLTGWLSGTRIHLPSERRGFDPWSERSPGEVNGNLLLYSCLENPMDRGAWQATVHGVAKQSDMA